MKKVVFETERSVLFSKNLRHPYCFLSFYNCLIYCAIYYCSLPFWNRPCCFQVQILLSSRALYLNLFAWAWHQDMAPLCNCKGRLNPVSCKRATGSHFASRAPFRNEMGKNQVWKGVASCGREETEKLTRIQPSVQCYHKRLAFLVLLYSSGNNMGTVLL